MSNANTVIIVAVLYTVALFTVAFIADRAATYRKSNFINSPLIYTLSLSVYCTAWTFYGAVGSAARNGVEFLAIYLGPTIIFVGWWWCLRRLVTIGRTEKLTSIADFVSARYGKSVTLGAIVTIIALIGTTPYIALQLQSLTLSFSVFAQQTPAEAPGQWENTIAFSIALGLAVFIALFGTNRLNASERHEGVVTAIALEAIIKLIALVTVGVMVVVWINTSTETIITPDLLDQFESNSLYSSRWATLICLSAFAIISLPRMFQVMVVENQNERQLAVASWAFPGYLFLMCLFVMPIALFGLATLGEDANPDLFVLTVPMSQGYDNLAILAFLGGFSSATSMVIMAALALATMVSNHLVLPLTLALQSQRSSARQDLREMTLLTRRLTIFLILGLGYLYYQFSSGTDALASIGLIAFLGVSQIIPPLIGGIFWHRATRPGAIAGVLSGFLLWGYTLFLPSFGSTVILPQEVLDQGLFGLWLLKPQALLGIEIDDPLVHAFVWSLGTNVVVFGLVSLATNPSDIERLQAMIFQSGGGVKPQRPLVDREASPHELLALTQRILGRADGRAFFRLAAISQGRDGLPEITVDLVEQLEREFASVLGAATAQALMKPFVGRGEVSVSDLIALADEQAAIRTYSAELESKSQELEETANQLRAANMQLVHLGQQRDHFLSKVSHELRTPMTSIRSFSEILKTKLHDRTDKSDYFAGIIHDESLRLTRLLDEILELSFLESGRPKLNLKEVAVSTLIDRALIATGHLIEQRDAIIHRPPDDLRFVSDEDRLVQAIINLVANGIKHNTKTDPQIWLVSRHLEASDEIELSVSDNGPGLPNADEIDIFQKFATASGTGRASGVGLGLPISAQIIKHLGGQLSVNSTTKGATFTITLPRNKQAE